MALTPLDAPPAETASAPRAYDSHRRTMAEGLAAGVLVLAAFAILIRTAVSAYLYPPYADAIDWAMSALQVERTHAWGAYLWSPHTEQRIPWVRLLEALAVTPPIGRWPVFLLGDLAAWLAGAAALAFVLIRSPLAPRTRLWVGAAAALVWTNAGLAEDFALPVFSVYLLVAGPALAAAALLASAPREGLRSVGFWAALAFAAAASGGNAAGLAIWPALFAVAALQGRERAQVFAILIAGAVCIVALEAGLGLPSRSLGRDSGDAVSHLLKMATYFSVFGGLPWTRSIRWLWVAATTGAAVWACAAWLTLRASHRRDRAAAPLVGAGVALMVFGGLTAALATLGRVDELPQAIVPTRYTPFAGLLQIGILLCIAPALERPARAARIALAALAVLALARDVHDGRVQLRAADRIRAASEAFDRTGQQGDVIIYPDPRRAIEVRNDLATRGLPY